MNFEEKCVYLPSHISFCVYILEKTRNKLFIKQNRNYKMICYTYQFVAVTRNKRGTEPIVTINEHNANASNTTKIRPFHGGGVFSSGHFSRDILKIQSIILPFLLQVSFHVYNITNETCSI